MKKKNGWTTKFKHLVIGMLALIVVFAGGMTGLASFLYSNVDYGSETQSDTLAGKDGYVDIDFRYAFYSDLDTSTGSEEQDVYADDGTTLIGDADTEIVISKETDGENGDEYQAKYYALNEFLVAHTSLSAELGVGTYTAVDTKVSSGDAVKGYSNGWIYTIVVTTAIHKNEEFITLGFPLYSGAYTMYKQSYSTAYTTKQTSDTVRKELSVPSGYSLTDTYVSGLFSGGVEGYSFYGLVDAVESNDTYVPSETLSLSYSYGDSITESKHFYAIFTKSTASEESTITTAVNNTSSGDTTNIYIGASGACNVSTDPTYVSSINNVALGTSEQETTVAEGATVNFCLNSSATQAYATYNEEPYDAETNPTGYYLKVEPQEENRQYTVSLQNDLNVKGTLVIGGTYGSGTCTRTEGNINSYYVVLDLNGHDINVSSTGSIYCYGMIIDSSSVPGMIHLNGGHITTLLVMLDYKDFANTAACAFTYICPFQLYFFPYLRCKVELKYDTDNGWGYINSFCRVHASSKLLLGLLPVNGLAADLALNFIGPEGGDTPFIYELEKPEEGKESEASVVYEYKTLDGVLSQTATTDDEKQDMEYIDDYSLYVRNCLTFNNVEFTMGTLDITFNDVPLLDTITVGYANDFNFPISPFFDISLAGSTFNLDSMVQFEAGSSLTVDADSTILFTTGTYSGPPYAGTSMIRFGSLSALDKGINYYDKELDKFVEGNALNGSKIDGYMVTEYSSSYEVTGKYDASASLTTFVDDTFWGNEMLWRYMGGASVNIMGKILFDCPDSSTEVSSRSSSGSYFKLAGEINFVEDNVGMLYYDSGTDSDTEIMFSDIKDGTYDETIVKNLVTMTGNTYNSNLYSYYVSTLGLSTVLDYLKNLDPFSAISILAMFMNRPIYVQTYGYDFIPNQYDGEFSYTKQLGPSLGSLFGIDSDDIPEYDGSDFYTLITYMVVTGSLSITADMEYAAANARGYARPLVSYGKAYVVNSIDNNTYYGMPTTMYEGTFDFDEGIFTSTKTYTIDITEVLQMNFSDGLVTSEESKDYYFDTYDTSINEASESGSEYYSVATEFSSFATQLSTSISTVDSKYHEQTPTKKYEYTSDYTYDLPNYDLALTPIESKGTDSIGPYITSSASGIEGAKYRYFAGIWVMDSNYYTNFQMQIMNYAGYIMAYAATGDMTYGPTYQTYVENLVNSLQTGLMTDLNAVTKQDSNTKYTVSYVGKLFSWANCSEAVLYYDSSCKCYKYDATYSSAVLNLEVNFANFMGLATSSSS